MAYTIEQLADELVNLRGPFFERVLDRMTEDEAKRLFELFCPGITERVADLEEELDAWEARCAGLERTVEDLEEEIEGLEERLREAENVEA